MLVSVNHDTGLLHTVVEKRKEKKGEMMESSLYGVPQTQSSRG